MPGQSHQRLIQSRSQVPDLDGGVRASSGNVVLVLVEVQCEDLVIMGLYCFHITACPEIPDSESFVAAAAGDNAFMGRVPDCLVSDKRVLERVQGGHADAVPDLDRLVVRSAEESSLVNVAPLS